jgi:hypothetical protein
MTQRSAASEGHTHAQLRNAQTSGTATNTQYLADITLPAGKAVDYRMDLSFMEADQFYLVDLQSQLAASGWPYHVQAVTAPPAAPANVAPR